MNAITRPLSAMQNAYLLGKSGLFPLGQSSMHDFRVFHGWVDLAALGIRLQALVQKYAALRTLIDELRLEQRVLPYIEITDHLQIIDLSTLPCTVAMQQLTQIEQQFCHYRHALDIPPWQIAVVQLPADAAHALVIFSSFDGLIVDGYAISVLLDALLYQDLQSITASPATLAPHCEDVQASVSDRQFWQQYLAQVNDIPALPWLTALDKISTPHYRRQVYSIAQSHWQQLSHMAVEHKVLPSCLLSSLILDVLSAWNTERRLLLSLPTSTATLDGAVGNDSSFIVLNYQFDPTQDVLDAAYKTQHDILNAMAHRSFSGLEIAKYLMQKTQQSLVLPIALTNGLTWKKLPRSTTLHYVTGQTQTPQLALDIRLSRSAEDDLCIEMDYVVEALSDHMVEQMLQALAQRISTLLDLGHLSQRLDAGAYTRTAGNELKKIKAENKKQEDKKQANGKQANKDERVDALELGVEPSEPIVQIENYLAKIEQHLYLKPLHTTALIYAGQQISYPQLAQQVRRMAQALDAAGVCQHDVVAICIAKSPEFIYSLLACALKGIVWLSIDLAAPPARRDYMLKNSAVSWIIAPETDVEHTQLQIAYLNSAQIFRSTTSAGAAKSPTSSTPLVFSRFSWSSIVEDDRQQHPCGYRFDGSPAYYLYTSGSTGNPKCVVLNHLATANVLQQSIARWNLQQDDVHFAATPFHHDMSIFDIMAPLSVGASLVIPQQQQQKNAVAWAELIAQHQVSIWCTVPAMAEMLLSVAQPQQLKSLRLICQGGDYIKATMVQAYRQHLPDVTMMSLGAPTETTIWSIWHEIQPSDRSVIPYGQALSHNQFYILDAYGMPCPTGVVGQLYMTGLNLANGYLLDGQLNQKDFVYLTLPDGQKKRAFRMSDKGYWREDGSIIFAGREEGYLKVRGVRIAALDVETALLQHPEILECVVCTVVNPRYEEQELMAVYRRQTPATMHQAEATHQTEATAPAMFKKFLQQSLPDSHIPTRWLAVADFPLSQNAKLDRKAIRQLAQQSVQQGYQATTTWTAQAAVQSEDQQLEQQILHYIQQLIPTPSHALSLHSDMISMGLNPQKLFQLTTMLRTADGLVIDFKKLLACKTLAELIEHIRMQHPLHCAERAL
ncbi:non-ribosomal peptide synthetase [Acinetobacter larvae]|uniref:Peptide synthetase n=1 Tax=Acinetobacter larvae TaxID=1789224 RepID=A0A1B2LX01_9GAMM|nr:non-ribosomal peptide synthetase [Acinetobacter larvae]AOA57303.1 hypothetical protein BFG52_02310 [Acinetobacter larvae]